MDGYQASGARNTWDRYKPQRENYPSTVQESRNTRAQQFPSGSEATIPSSSTHSHASHGILSQPSTSGSCSTSSTPFSTSQNSYGMQAQLSSSGSHSLRSGGSFSSHSSYGVSGQTLVTGSSTAMPDTQNMTSDLSSSWNAIGPRRHQVTPNDDRHGGTLKPTKDF